METSRRKAAIICVFVNLRGVYISPSSSPLTVTRLFVRCFTIDTSEYVLDAAVGGRKCSRGGLLPSKFRRPPDPARRAGPGHGRPYLLFGEKIPWPGLLPRR